MRNNNFATLCLHFPQSTNSMARHKIFPVELKGNVDDRKPDVIKLWSPVICFSRFYGIIHLKKCDHEPYFEKCTGSFCWGLFLSLIYIFTLLIAVLVLKDSLNESSTVIVESSHYVIYYLHCELTLVYFLLYSDDFANLMQKWIDTEILLNLNKIRLGSRTKVKCWIIYLAIIILCTAENSVYIFSTVFIIVVILIEFNFK